MASTGADGGGNPGDGAAAAQASADADRGGFGAGAEKDATIGDVVVAINNLTKSIDDKKTPQNKAPKNNTLSTVLGVAGNLVGNAILPGTGGPLLGGILSNIGSSSTPKTSDSDTYGSESLNSTMKAGSTPSAPQDTDKSILAGRSEGIYPEPPATPATETTDPPVDASPEATEASPELPSTYVPRVRNNIREQLMNKYRTR